MSIIIYSTQITPRLTYIAELFFCDILGSTVEFTEHLTEFEKANGAIKICYRNGFEPDSIGILPHEILFETDVKQQQIEVVTKHDVPVFFENHDDFVGFDFLAAAFFMVTRYEEYLPTELDNHQRFKAENTIAFKHNFLKLPIVQVWANLVAKKLAEIHHEFKPKQIPYNLHITVDVDRAFAFKGENKIQQILLAGRDFFSLKFANCLNRLLVLFALKEDAFNTFNQLKQLETKYNLKFIYFFLLSHKGLFNNANSLTNKGFRNLINQLSNNNQVGLHPSYKTSENQNLLAEEKSNLQGILNKKVSISRQHFFRFSLPKTYRILQNEGLTNDYSMGFHNHFGFRAGLAIPFNFFDLTLNKKLDIKIHPFQAVDVAAINFLNLNQADALSAFEEMAINTKKYGGTFCIVWHNDTLSKLGKYKSWQNFLEQVIKIAN